jgi:hypothetical protein
LKNLSEKKIKAKNRGLKNKRKKYQKSNSKASGIKLIPIKQPLGRSKLIKDSMEIYETDVVNQLSQSKYLASTIPSEIYKSLDQQLQEKTDQKVSKTMPEQLLFTPLHQIKSYPQYPEPQKPIQPFKPLNPPQQVKTNGFEFKNNKTSLNTYGKIGQMLDDELILPVIGKKSTKPMQYKCPTCDSTVGKEDEICQNCGTYFEN